MVDHRTPEQRRDDDFEAIRRGLNEAIAHAKGEPEAEVTASLFQMKRQPKYAHRLRLTLRGLDCDVLAGPSHRCSRLSEAIFVDHSGLSLIRTLAAIQFDCS